LLIEFEDCIDELEFLDSRDSAENLFYKFNLIAEKLKLYKVSKRVEKEARELRGNLSNYPPKEIKEKNEELRKKIVTLQSKAKNCKYCDIPMVIRESDNGYFWGCSNFPDCWSKFQLSNEDIEFLFE